VRVRLQQNLWNGDSPVDISLPEDWNVQIVRMPCDDQPVLSYDQVRERIENPLGTEPLSRQAAGRKRVCIVFDDISRATPSDVISQVVLDILLEAGVSKENIFFLCSPGSHGPHNRRQFAHKLGEKIVSSYPVYNHNCYENCTYLGKSREGFDIRVNSQYLSSDLRIGIGGLLPHAMSGFSGGGRLLIPGLCHLDTMEQIHRMVNDYIARIGDMTVLSGAASNMMMQECIAEIVEMTGPFFKIDCIYNSTRGIVDIFAGDVLEEYVKGAARAEKMYGVPRPVNPSVVIANANSKPGYATMALSLGLSALAEEGGDVVLVNFAVEGQSVHFLRGDFGDAAPSRIPVAAPPDKRPYGKTIYFSPYGDYNSISNLHIQPDRYVWARTWEEVMNHLRSHGPGTRAAVLTDACMMFFRS
jgi:nickel-dependent lactate racemase